jgi:L-aminopeptidase/D-esterase-like protein
MGARPVLVGLALLAAAALIEIFTGVPGVVQAFRPAVVAAQAGGARQNTTLTAVPGIKVGHHTLTERPTGCTVVLAEAGVTAGVDVRGSAPATRETDLLNPVNLVQVAHAIVLSGGSAFGLDSASGVMRYLEEKRIGFAFGATHVPIVPAAAIFDLLIGDGRVRPGPDCGYQAARVATDAPVTEGSVGAGAGATLGKAGGMSRSMKGGVGSASITLPTGLVVAALVVVNAAGDVIDPANGQVVAGVRTADGKSLADARKILRAGGPGAGAAPAGRQNTTLGVVATNALLTKTEATRVSQMAHDGYARARAPAHTPGDGDVIFTLATGGRVHDGDAAQVGALAADVMADAIVRAARQATGVPGYPAIRDLK